MSLLSRTAQPHAKSTGSHRSLGRLRWLLATVAAFGMMGIPQLVPAVQASGASWYDGSIQYSTITNCVSIIQSNPYQEFGAGAYVGFYANPDAAAPAPNSVYYVHVVVYGLGNACSGMRIWPEIALPSNTSLAIDGTNKVYCYAGGVSDPTNCPQSLPSSGYHPGAYAIPSPDAAHGNTWPLPQGGNWEFRIPVRSTTQLSGAALTGNVWVLDGNSSPWLAPQEGVYVFGGTPTILYPSPSTTLIGTNQAKSWATLYSHGDVGTAYFDLGTTTSYGLVTDPVAIASGTGWTLWDDWTPFPLQPNTLYHFRIRFADSSKGVTYYGADQTFRTLPTLLVAGDVSPYVAGASHSITVTALNANGTTNAGYRGTVHFTSSDTHAVLPANYAFTAGDAGTHTFNLGVRLKTVGTRSVTATDTVTASIHGSQTPIVVKPAAATHLAVSVPSSWVAGASHTATITARDAYGNTATGYRGTIHFTSSDTHAVLPANYTFTSGDAGVHTFTAGVKLKTAGSRSVTATDTVTASITGVKSGISVTPAAAKNLTVTLTGSFVSGASHSVTITAKDAYGNTATGYRGTIHFTSSDTHAVLPANYTFTSGDSGVHTFTAGVKLKTVGTQWVRATDTVTVTITGIKTGIVVS